MGFFGDLYFTWTWCYYLSSSLSLSLLFLIQPCSFSSSSSSALANLALGESILNIGSIWGCHYGLKLMALAVPSLSSGEGL
jgi:hypothetical protein